MFWDRISTGLVELSPDEVRQRMARFEIVLVDVREADEYARERIQGAVSFPLSTFDPARLPGGNPGRVVFHCASGKRSAMAVARCQQVGVPANKHMRGGIAAWKAAGLPTVL